MCFRCALGGSGRNAARGWVRLRRRRRRGRKKKKKNARGTDWRSNGETLTSLLALWASRGLYEASHSRSHAGRQADRLAGRSLRGPGGGGRGGTSHGHRGVRLFGPVVHHVLELARVGDVVARLVLGQDLHEGTQLEPPLLLGDPVAAHKDGNKCVNIRSEDRGCGDSSSLHKFLKGKCIASELCCFRSLLH